ncbi:hypothetical protein [Peribacillus loiseleuriae]|uniref:hypothetical protein n=1 Tax=Peribacillus loiseleuriae TaxID=1679170 RepID=UPI003D0763C8
MITLSSLDELRTVNSGILHVKAQQAKLFEQTHHVISLTRALRFHYQYVGCLILDKDTSDCAPKFESPSVVHLYEQGVAKFKQNPSFPIIKQIFTNAQDIGFAKICLMIGRSSEKLVGAVIMK